jgi:hypothetical protein
LGTVYGATSSASPNNAFLGYQAAANVTGTNNVAIGFQSLQTSVSGGSNTAVGYQALNALTNTSGNTAVGYQAAGSAVPGFGAITAVGYQAIKNTTNNSTAVGYAAGPALTSGTQCVFLGHDTGKVIATGDYNIYVGNTISASSSSVSNELVISCNTATGKGANTGFINPTGGGVYQGNNATTWSITSDRRLKKNIVDNNVGLDALKSIQVRNFEYRLPEEVEELDANCAIDKQGVQIGVIAQELQAVLPDCVKQESTGVLGLQSDNLTWYTINAIKQLSAALDAANARIAALEAK